MLREKGGDKGEHDKIPFEVDKIIMADTLKY